jgi:AraC family transcriptional regulator
MQQRPEHPEGVARMARLIDYIFTRYEEDVSLETLAGVAHYSKDHLPRLFKAVVGETPKQYSLALRLEAAFHHLVIQSEKPVQEIALEGGFSGLSVFSRAIKNRYGYSPEEIRRLPHSRQMRLLHGDSRPSLSDRSADQVDQPEIQVVRVETMSGIYLAAPFDDAGKIEEAFRALSALYPRAPAFYGILMPHLRNTYRAFLPLAERSGLFPDQPFCVIKKGLYAWFTVSGDLRATNKAAHYFYRQWLPASGYRIAGIAGFERFDGHPMETPYFALGRSIHIPIAPKL